MIRGSAHMHSFNIHPLQVCQNLIGPIWARIASFLKNPHRPHNSKLFPSTVTNWGRGGATVCYNWYWCILIFIHIFERTTDTKIIFFISIIWIISKIYDILVLSYQFSYQFSEHYEIANCYSFVYEEVEYKIAFCIIYTWYVGLHYKIAFCIIYTWYVGLHYKIAFCIIYTWYVY